MIFSLIETRENKLTFYKIKNFRAKLRFINMRKMTQFLYNNRFQPYFDIYVDV